jgi:hypothetical protein
MCVIVRCVLDEASVFHQKSSFALTFSFNLMPSLTRCLFVPYLHPSFLFSLIFS